MTIHDFEWTYFWETLRYMSWFELGMTFCFGLCWFRALRGSNFQGGSALRIVALLGWLFGIGYKLYHNLDVVVLVYAFFALTTFTDIVTSMSLRRYKAQEELSAQTKARRAELIGGSSTKSGHSRHGSSSHSRSHGSSHHSKSSEGRRFGHRHSHSHSKEPEAKEPLFGDSVAFDEVSESK